MKKQKYGKIELEFTIGDWVEVNQNTNMFYEHNERRPVWSNRYKGRIGQVCGVVTKYSGRRVYDDCAYFVPNKSYLFYEVKFSLINKPIFVDAENLTIATEHLHRLPAKLGIKWTEQAKQDFKTYIAKYPEEFPRDSKERFK